MPVAGSFDPGVRPRGEETALGTGEAAGNRGPARDPRLQLSRYLGLDLIEVRPIPVRTSLRNVIFESKTEGDFTTEVWRTRSGDLRHVFKACRSPSGEVSSNFIEHAVKGPGDLDALVAIHEDEAIEPDPEGIIKIRQTRDSIGDDGLLIACTPGTPLGAMYRVFSGVSNLAYLWADAPGALRDCFAVMERNYLRRLKTGIHPDIDALQAVDDTSTTVISPGMFESCNIGLTDARAEAAHAAGKLYIHHSCGHIRDLLPLYRKTKMDAVDQFTVPPLGNVTVGEGRRLLGDRITIIAGLPHGAWQDDRNAAREIIQGMLREAGPRDHFILKISPPFGYHPRLEQIRFIVECCREIGGGRD